MTKLRHRALVAEVGVGDAAYAALVASGVVGEPQDGAGGQDGASSD